MAAEKLIHVEFSCVCFHCSIGGAEECCIAIELNVK